MSSNLPLVRQSRRVLPWSEGLKLEINIPSQWIRAKRKLGLINEGGEISSEYSTAKDMVKSTLDNPKWLHNQPERLKISGEAALFPVLCHLQSLVYNYNTIGKAGPEPAISDRYMQPL